MNKLFYSLIIVLTFLSSCSSDDNEEEVTTGDSKIVFSSFENINCGDITVSLEGVGNKIIPSTATPIGLDICNDTHINLAKFDNLVAGSYNYSASCTSYTWTGVITVGNMGCSGLSFTVLSAD
ncbi:hypothetical protein SAMN05444411_101790 [Lutibacter oricola]|uniref:Lipoprotein n=1 Tax=Lutibacter oricola TaxID=762486 RepID=A0A1H2TRZ6_9FLAO|nr:hypothetical protein [Lutibacter oricola]SDW46631.1 hypothetical protein SAMN05444411_101790 [Lutibacter oricola]